MYASRCQEQSFIKYDYKGIPCVSRFLLAGGILTIFRGDSLTMEKKILRKTKFQKQTSIYIQMNINKVYIKLNCAFNNVNIILYFLQPMEFYLIKS
jgi:hypothetical protein